MKVVAYTFVIALWFSPWLVPATLLAYVSVRATRGISSAFVRVLVRSAALAASVAPKVISLSHDSGFPIPASFAIVFEVLGGRFSEARADSLMVLYVWVPVLVGDVLYTAYRQRAQEAKHARSDT